MNRYTLTGLLALSLITAAPLLHANESDMSSMQSSDYVDKKLGKLTKELQLTPDQQTPIKVLLEDQKSKMQAAQSPEQKKQVHEETSRQIQAVLTETQRVKYAKMKKEHRKDMKDNKGNKTRMDNQAPNAGSQTDTMKPADDVTTSPQQTPQQPQGSNSTHPPAGY